MVKRIVLIKDTAATGPDTTRDFYNRFLDGIREHKLLDEIMVVRAADLGYYGHGLVVKIMPNNIVYHNVQNTDIERIIKSTIEKNQILDDLILNEKPKQIKVALRNCGLIDPENINDYIAHDGYKALSNVLLEFTPEK